MNTAQRLALAVCAALALVACKPRPQPTQAQVESVIGLSSDAVQNKIGPPDVVTNGGESVWWDYSGVIMADGNKNGSCHVVLVKDIATQVKC